MATTGKDPRVDAYIAAANDFARPILEELRRRVHTTCPGITETLKWGAPHFEYKGRMFAGMSAFKAHCAFGFWHPLMRNGDTSLEGMGQFGRIESVADLPARTAFEKLARKAMKLTDDNVKAPPKPRAPPKPVVVPKDLAALLRRNQAAGATFEAFSPSHRREYVEWIGEAKTEGTRDKRLAATVAQLAEGKSLHWKYQTR